MANLLGLVNDPPSFSEDLENFDSTGNAVNLFGRDRFLQQSYFDSFGGATSSTRPVPHGNDGLALAGGNSYNEPIVDSRNSQPSLPSFPESFPAGFDNDNALVGVTAPFVLPPVARLPSYRDVCDTCEPPTVSALSPPSFVNLTPGLGGAAAEDQDRVVQSQGPLTGVANPATPPSFFSRINRINSPSLIHSRPFCNQPAFLPPPTTATDTTQTSSYPPPPFTTSTPLTYSLGAEPTSNDFYVSALATGDFSSPSLPPFSSPSRPSATELHANQILPRASPFRERDAMPRQPREVTAASQRTRRSSRSSVVDLTKEEHNNTSPTIELSSPMAPPPTRRRTRATATNLDTSSSTTSRQRPAAAQSTQPSQTTKPTKRKRASRDEGSSPIDPSPFDSSSVVGNDDDDLLDLTKPEEPQAKPREEHKIKLSGFQCVICMDDVSNLTVTHCGHMFCSECLHSALYIDSMKRTCPVCRTKVTVENKSGKKDTKSYYHLELKLMTANRKGKQRAAG